MEKKKNIEKDRDREPGFNPWVEKISWRRAWATHSSILPWRIPMNRGAWRATVHGFTKSRTQLSY